MSRIEGPQVFAAIISLALIAIVITFVAPGSIDKIVGAVVTGIGMRGVNYPVPRAQGVKEKKDGEWFIF